VGTLSPSGHRFDAETSRGVEIDDAKIRASTNWAFVNMLAEREESGGVDTISQMLLGRDRESPWRKKPPRHFKTVDPYETLFEVLLERQNEDGSWPPEGQLTTPPEIGEVISALEIKPSTPYPHRPTQECGDEQPQPGIRFGNSDHSIRAGELASVPQDEILAIDHAIAVKVTIIP